MALVKILDFCSALKVKEGTVRSKISRGQLICNEKRIDTNEPINFKYILEINGGDQSVFDEYSIPINSLSKINKKTLQKTKTPKKIAEKKIVQKVFIDKPLKSNHLQKKDVEFIEEKKESTPIKETFEERKIKREQKMQREMLLQYDLRKKEAEVTLVERNAELKQMELEKKAGNTLPLDLVKKILVINMQGILINVNTELENMVNIAVEELGGNRADTVRITNKIRTVFKKTIDVTKNRINQEITTAVTEYSEVRSRGERK